MFFLTPKNNPCKLYMQTGRGQRSKTLKYVSLKYDDVTEYLHLMLVENRLHSTWIMTPGTGLLLLHVSCLTHTRTHTHTHTHAHAYTAKCLQSDLQHKLKTDLLLIYLFLGTPCDKNMNHSNWKGWIPTRVKRRHLYGDLKMTTQW